MGAQRGVSEKKIAAALRKHAGILILAAKELDMSRQNVWARVDRSKTLQAILKEIDEEHLDIGEGHIISGLRTGDREWTQFYMRCKGKKRGYGNSVHVGLDEAAIEAIVQSLGGNTDKLRAALLRLGVDPDQGS